MNQNTDPGTTHHHYHHPAQVSPAKTRVAYVLLGLFLGAIGIHNFYAGRNGVAVVQLLLAICTCGAGALVTALWALIEVLTVTTDGAGNPLV